MEEKQATPFITFVYDDTLEKEALWPYYHATWPQCIDVQSSCLDNWSAKDSALLLQKYKTALAATLQHFPCINENNQAWFHIDYASWRAEQKTPSSSTRPIRNVLVSIISNVTDLFNSNISKNTPPEDLFSDHDSRDILKSHYKAVWNGIEYPDIYNILKNLEKNCKLYPELAEVWCRFLCKSIHILKGMLHNENRIVYGNPHLVYCALEADLIVTNYLSVLQNQNDQPPYPANTILQQCCGHSGFYWNHASRSVHAVRRAYQNTLTLQPIVNIVPIITPDTLNRFVLPKHHGITPDNAYLHIATLADPSMRLNASYKKTILHYLYVWMPALFANTDALTLPIHNAKWRPLPLTIITLGLFLAISCIAMLPLMQLVPAMLSFSNLLILLIILTLLNIFVVYTTPSPFNAVTHHVTRSERVQMIAHGLHFIGIPMLLIVISMMAMNLNLHVINALAVTIASVSVLMQIVCLCGINLEKHLSINNSAADIQA
jgi:hypothetical protein